MSTIYDWSFNASENAYCDDLIDWSEGQRPSSLNNSARGMMQRVKEYLSDTSGVIESTFTVDIRYNIKKRNKVNSLHAIILYEST